MYLLAYYSLHPCTTAQVFKRRIEHLQGAVIVDILHRVGIESPSDAVFKALTTREGLAGWWTRTVEGDTGPGGVITFRFHSAEGAELGFFDMKVVELDADKQVLWQVVGGPEEWLGTRVSWQLRQEGDYCMVLFKHQGWKEPVEFMHHCSTKWAIFLMSLKALVETGAGAPSPNDVKIDNFN
jgi:uncharacterized protein YndB with AHSA1/START domain